MDSARSENKAGDALHTGMLATQAICIIRYRLVSIISLTNDYAWSPITDLRHSDTADKSRYFAINRVL